MFQFRRFPTYCYLIHSTLIRYCRTGFPHSDISGSMLICSSPKLFAACHVLHRLPMPRHSPYALLRLNYFKVFNTFCISFDIHRFSSLELLCFILAVNIFRYSDKIVFFYPKQKNLISFSRYFCFSLYFCLSCMPH